MKKVILILVVILIAVNIIVVLYYRSLPKGFAQVDAGDANAVFVMRSGIIGYKTITSKAPKKVTVNIYKPILIKISKKKDGKTYQLTSHGPWQDLSKIKIEEEKTTPIKFGPPLIIKPTVSRNGSYVSVNYLIIGQAGEQYDYSRSARVPKVKIIDENGNVLVSGSFAYG